ncbi:hypothetical protein T4B_12113 [Trichinella pseudospiralis]|uniref:Uncharacterized protein n=1 Tax=Trichinella pseudospiralis TaxID=6337 RepID=A0A0V1ING2_TRIPS|nr:hypothetical protein T4B_12113 [Trichinella pseudospiralis]
MNTFFEINIIRKMIILFLFQNLNNIKIAKIELTRHSRAKYIDQVNGLCETAAATMNKCQINQPTNRRRRRDALQAKANFTETE